MIRLFLAVALVTAGCSSSTGGTGGSGGGAAGGAGGAGGGGLKCGNGTLETDEVCEGFELRGKSCASEGFELGQLKCTSSCTLDVSACSKCGDGKITGAEKCDGVQFAGRTCANQLDAGAMGELSCEGTCTQISTNNCTFPPGRNETCFFLVGCSSGLVCDLVNPNGSAFVCRLHCPIGGVGSSQGCAATELCRDGGFELEGATASPPQFPGCPTDGGSCGPGFSCLDAGIAGSACAKRTGYCQ